MANLAQSLKDLMRIRAHNRDYLDSINGNLGTALGFKKRTGDELPSPDAAVIVYVPQKINPKWLGTAAVKDKLEGPNGLWCWVDIVEGGKAETEDLVPQSPSSLAERLRGWDSQIWVGSQLSHWTDSTQRSYEMGTLGAFVKNQSHLGILTNQHVGIRAGQPLFHPVPWGKRVGVTQHVVEYVEDQDYYGPFIDEPQTWVRVDAAFVAIDADFKRDDLNPQMMGVGKLGPVKEVSLDDMSIIGQKVIRVGRTTGLRRGTIAAFGYEYRDEQNATVYTDFLIAGNEGVPFSTHGDSGSLIVTDDAQRNPIALLWGGWQEKLRTDFAQENWTYATMLSRILAKLDLKLVTDPADF